TFRKHASNWPNWYTDVDVVTMGDSAGYIAKTKVPTDCLDSRTLTLAGRKQAEDARTRRRAQRERKRLQMLHKSLSQCQPSPVVLADYKGVWLGSSESVDPDPVRRWNK